MKCSERLSPVRREEQRAERIRLGFASQGSCASPASLALELLVDLVLYLVVHQVDHQRRTAVELVLRHVVGGRNTDGLSERHDNLRHILAIWRDAYRGA